MGQPLGWRRLSRSDPERNEDHVSIDGQIWSDHAGTTGTNQANLSSYYHHITAATWAALATEAYPSLLNASPATAKTNSGTISRCWTRTSSCRRRSSPRPSLKGESAREHQHMTHKRALTISAHIRLAEQIGFQASLTSFADYVKESSRDPSKRHIYTKILGREQDAEWATHLASKCAGT
ncbi:hypothetical protein L1887_49861 [Cichorium endivia]|nr:hypothetical protein L1887_49861 [Cichorium endivia]